MRKYLHIVKFYLLNSSFTIEYLPNLYISIYMIIVTVFLQTNCTFGRDQNKIAT